MTGRVWLGLAALVCFFVTGLMAARHDWAEAAVFFVLGAAFARASWS